MMRDFVAQNVVDGLTNLARRAAVQFNGTAINRNLIRQNQAVVMGALRLRDAMIEAEQSRRIALTDPAQRFTVGPIFHDDFDVLQTVTKGFRKRIQRLCNPGLEKFTIHNVRS